MYPTRRAAAPWSSCFWDLLTYSSKNSHTVYNISHEIFLQRRMSWKFLRLLLLLYLQEHDWILWCIDIWDFLLTIVMPLVARALYNIFGGFGTGELNHFLWIFPPSFLQLGSRLGRTLLVMLEFTVTEEEVVSSESNKVQIVLIIQVRRISSHPLDFHLITSSISETGTVSRLKPFMFVP